MAAAAAAEAAMAAEREAGKARLAQALQQEQVGHVSHCVSLTALLPHPLPSPPRITAAHHVSPRCVAHCASPSPPLRAVSPTGSPTVPPTV
jgi:hypothetical protein